MFEIQSTCDALVWNSDYIHAALCPAVQEKSLCNEELKDLWGNPIDCYRVKIPVLSKVNSQFLKCMPVSVLFSNRPEREGAPFMSAPVNLIPPAQSVWMEQWLGKPLLFFPVNSQTHKTYHRRSKHTQTITGNFANHRNYFWAIRRELFIQLWYWVLEN